MRVVPSQSGPYRPAYGQKKQQEDISTPKIPRGLRSTASPSAVSDRQELAQLNQDAARIANWWTQPRWQHTKRAYSGK